MKKIKRKNRRALPLSGRSSLAMRGRGRVSVSSEQFIEKHETLGAASASTAVDNVDNRLSVATANTGTADEVDVGVGVLVLADGMAGQLRRGGVSESEADEVDLADVGAESESESRSKAEAGERREEEEEVMSLKRLRPCIGMRGQRTRGHNGRRDRIEFGSSMDCPIAVNLTKHLADDSIKEDGRFRVVDFEGGRRRELFRLLTFNNVPVWEEIEKRAKKIADLAGATRAKYAWIGGAPYLCAVLVGELKKRGITPIFSYSFREFMEVGAAGESSPVEGMGGTAESAGDAEMTITTDKAGRDGADSNNTILLKRCYTHIGWIVF